MFRSKSKTGVDISRKCTGEHTVNGVSQDVSFFGGGG
jgi:hypothetical protein